MKVKLTEIKASKDNAAGRSEMNEAMEELIATIKAVGVCEGISVRPNGKGYEVIGGERRLFAAKKAGLKEVDVIVHDVDPRGNGNIPFIIKNIYRYSPLCKQSTNSSIRRRLPGGAPFCPTDASHTKHSQNH